MRTTPQSLVLKLLAIPVLASATSSFGCAAPTQSASTESLAVTNAARGVAREAAREVATTKPVNVPQAAPITAPTTAPTTATIVIQTKRSSLPAAPQMMDDAPRPTFIPAPTPIVKPGQKIIISNGIAPTPQPRENPTIIISNGPKSP